MNERTKLWLKCAAVRAVKTVAQTAVATIGVSAAMSDVDWMLVGSASLLAGILSLLTSVAGLPEVDNAELAESLTVDPHSGLEIRKTDNSLRVTDMEAPQEARPLEDAEIVALIAEVGELDGDA